MDKLNLNSVDPELYQLAIQLMRKEYLKNYFLVGGTALALQLGHRKSDDIDLFSNVENNYDEIKYELGLLTTELKSTFKNSVVAKINNIKVDIIQYNYPWLEKPEVFDEIRIAGLKDIAAMKLSAIAQRGAKKDFWDIYFLLDKFPLKEMLDMFCEKFNQTEILHVLRSLDYFDFAEQQNDPFTIIPVKWKDIKKKISSELKKVIYK